MVIVSTIKKGYKQTELGVIPEDWELKSLGDCLIRPSRYGIGAAAVEYSDQLPKYIRITDISETGRFFPEKAVSVNDPCSKHYFLEDGDLVVARTGASVGKSYLYRLEDGPLVFAGFLICLTSNKNILLPQYLANYLRTTLYWNWVKLTSMRSGQPGINGKEYARLSIPLPKITEQTAIAAVLSDTDALIEHLEKLIAKKKAIKQGAMQQLLTGKERLPGFSGEWEPKKLGDVGHCFAGGTPSTFNSNYWGGSYIWLPSGRVQNNILRKMEDEITITQRGLDESAAKLIKRESILIAITGATCGNIGLLEFEAAANQSVVAIEPSGNYDYRFLYYSLLMKRAVILSGRGGSAQGGVNLATVKNIGMMFPEKSEQAAIANFLSDMDVEIDKLEQKRDKYTMLKQGMMQQLLTGKIRIYANN